jgi:AraC-like DNA-binding protein
VAKPVPIYRNDAETAHADACGPLVQAASRHTVRLEALIHGHYPGKPLPPESLSGLKTVGFWDADSAQTWGLPWHRNEGIEITFLETGRLGFGVDKQECVLEADDLTITRPWQLHHVGDPNVGAGRLIWLIVDVGVRRPDETWKWPPWVLLTKPDLDEFTNFLRHTERPVWRVSLEIRRCFQEIAKTVEREQNGNGISRLTIRLNDLFLLMLDLFRRQHVPLDESLSTSRHTVELFLIDLRSHLDHLAMPWNVREMSDSCGLGVTQFLLHVRRLLNMTPMHYLNHWRLEHAAHMLREDPQVSITDVALNCGFSSSQYFATAFSAKYGNSPREYRRT